MNNSIFNTYILRRINFYIENRERDSKHKCLWLSKFLKDDPKEISENYLWTPEDTGILVKKAKNKLSELQKEHFDNFVKEIKSSKNLTWMNKKEELIEAHCEYFCLTEDACKDVQAMMNERMDHVVREISSDVDKIIDKIGLEETKNIIIVYLKHQLQA